MNLQVSLNSSRENGNTRCYFEMVIVSSFRFVLFLKPLVMAFVILLLPLVLLVLDGCLCCISS